MKADASGLLCMAHLRQLSLAGSTPEKPVIILPFFLLVLLS